MEVRVPHSRAAAIDGQRAMAIPARSSRGTGCREWDRRAVGRSLALCTALCTAAGRPGFTWTTSLPVEAGSTREAVAPRTARRSDVAARTAMAKHCRCRGGGMEVAKNPLRGKGSSAAGRLFSGRGTKLVCVNEVSAPRYHRPEFRWVAGGYNKHRSTAYVGPAKRGARKGGPK